MIANTATWASVAIRNTPVTSHIPRPMPTSANVKSDTSEKTTSEITNNVVSSTVKTEVHPQALEIAKDFYSKHYEQIVQTQHREELRSVFTVYAPQANNRAFSIVLYAMAKGMRVVNVFNHGQVEWRESSATQEFLSAKKRTTRQKLIVQSDGWTSVGVPSTDILEETQQPKQQTHPVSKPTITVPKHTTRVNDNLFVSLAESEDTKEDAPSPRFSKEGEYIVKTKATAFPEYSMDDLIERIRGLTDRIKTHDMEIENLIPFHREHLREMRRINALENRSELEERLYSFHDTHSQQVADMLDNIQDEMNRLIKEKRELCDQLKF